MENKIKAWASAATAAALTFPALAVAQGWTGPCEKLGGTGLFCGSLGEVLSNLLNFLLGILAILAVIGFVVSGIMYLTAAGDEERVEKAKKMMTYTIIGVVVALIGLVIVNTIDMLIKGN